MVKHFYSFIVETDTLFMEIDSLSISDSEKSHLKSLAESHLHHSILDTILSELTPENKKEFMSRINTKEYDNIWKFLHNNIENIEEKIQDTALKVKKQLFEDVKDAKSSNG